MQNECNAQGSCEMAEPVSVPVKLVDLFGPFAHGNHYEVMVEGQSIPGIKVYETDDGQLSVTLDGRFGVTTTRDELERWAWFIANAMAVAAGYTCFGRDARPSNPFGLLAVP